MFRANVEPHFSSPNLSHTPVRGITYRFRRVFIVGEPMRRPAALAA